MTDGSPFPDAIPAPDGREVVIDDDLIDGAIRMSRESPRGRIIQRLHREDQDPLQRMLNAMQPGSYVRPHRHEYPPRAEAVLVVRGAIGVVLFNKTGEITAAHRFHPGTGIDIRAGTMHSLIALEPDSVAFEAKGGPFLAKTEADFASWAPKEGAPESIAYLEELEARFS